MQFLRFALLLCGFGIQPAPAEPVRTAHVTAELVTAFQSLVPGEGDASRIGLRLEMAPHWHTYWRFPGDSGLPTEVSWDLPAGWSAGPLEWPVPQRILVPPIVNFGYDGDALLAAPLRIPRGTEGEFSIGAHASWLVCKEECVPEKADLTLRVKVGKEKGQPGALADAFRKLREEQPVAPAGIVTVSNKDKLFGISVPDPDGFLAAAKEIDFFPLAPMLLKGESPAKVEAGAGKVTLWLEKADPLDAKASALPGVIVAKNRGQRKVIEMSAPIAPVTAQPAVIPAGAAPEEISPWLLVLFAFVGGVILNLMPCVFPVLGIKVMSLVRQGSGNAAHARSHGLAYAAGVVVCFWALAAALLALRAAGQAVGWGFQLQQPMFVTALILLFTFVAADLAGYIHWSGRWMGVGEGLAGREGLLGSFFTGVLAVVVATPCTAPFMGTAIGAAIGEPAWVVAIVFTSLGAGLALPFLLLCSFPAYLRHLPKPGAWMERLKELLAFPIAATVVWLLWVLTQQIGADGAFKVEGGLLLMMFSVWMRRRLTGQLTKGFSHLVLLIGIAGCVVGGRSAVGGSAGADGPWKPYTEAALEEALSAGKPVFVDFTAAWCLTCQVNRKLVLERADLQEYFREKGVVLLLADWTNRDPAITRALERYGRIGVPLYLAYPAGSKNAEVLPQILTEGRIRSSFH